MGDIGVLLLRQKKCLFRIFSQRPRILNPGMVADKGPFDHPAWPLQPPHVQFRA